MPDFADNPPPDKPPIMDRSKEHFRRNKDEDKRKENVSEQKEKKDQGPRRGPGI